MHYLRNLARVPQSIGRTVVTIGSYDGIHIGHQQIILKQLEVARQQQLPAVLMSFDPYPKEFFMGRSVPRLMSWREKFLALQALGIDYFLALKFDHALSEMSAEEFVRKILVEGLGVKFLIIGDDFHFGKNRMGNYDTLCELGKMYDFSVWRAPTYYCSNERVSSSRIRYLLQAGELSQVNNWLGHHYFLYGTVVHGDKLGRQLGFPTANIHLHRRHVPLHGIYVVRVSGWDGRIYNGVANIGSRPAVGGTRVLLEVFIFDFDQVLYGLNIKVEFLHKLRDEAHYDSLELLKEQIGRDVQDAKAWHDSYALDERCQG